jgi:hypothetical protein
MRPGARADLGRPTTSTHQNKEPLPYPNDSSCIQMYPVFKIFAGQKQSRHIHYISYLSYLRLNRVLQKLEGRLHEPPAGT